MITLLITRISNLKTNLMKKMTLILILIISVLSITNAQFTKIGGGLALTNGFHFHNMPVDANRSGMMALSFKGIYEIEAPLQVSPSFTVFFPNITKDLSSKTTVSSVTFDINGHYVFNSLEKFELYGLAGLDILYASKRETIQGSPTNNESDNTMGLNVGAGTSIKITEKFDIYGEVKYVLSKSDHLMLNVGIFFNLEPKKNNENSGL